VCLILSSSFGIETQVLAKSLSYHPGVFPCIYEIHVNDFLFVNVLFSQGSQRKPRTVEEKDFFLPYIIEVTKLLNLKQRKE
jgi:hypothetical protein